MATSDKLSKNDLRTVRNKVHEVAAKWYDLGVELGILPDQLDAIRQANHKPQDCLRELLLLWLASVDPEPTWKALSKALCEPAVGYQSLAADIEQEYYCINYEALSRSPSQSHAEAEEQKITPCGLPTSPQVNNAYNYKTNEERLNRSLPMSSTLKDLEENPSFSTHPPLNTAARTDSTSERSSLKSSVTVADPSKDPRSMHPPWLSIPMDTSTNKSEYESPASQAPVEMVRPVIKKAPHKARSFLSTMAEERSTQPLYFEDSGSEPEELLPISYWRRPVHIHQLRSISLSSSTFPARYKGSEYKFVNKPAEDLSCQKCKELANEPCQMECCFLLFCKACVPTVCPKCQNSNKGFADGRSHHRILSLKIVCPNDTKHGLECNWVGELRNLSKHRQGCPREQILCPFDIIGCNMKMYKSKLKDHEVEYRETHLKLAMKQVLSQTRTIKKLQERLEKQENALEGLKEEVKKLTLHFN